MDIGRILPTEAAAILNVSPQFVRVQSIRTHRRRRKCPARDIFPDVRGFCCQQTDAFALRSHTDSVHDGRAGDDRGKTER